MWAEGERERHVVIGSALAFSQLNIIEKMVTY